MGCFSGRLMSVASDQKLFCKLCSPFCCSFNEFVEEKVISPSYSSAVLTPPGIFFTWGVTVIFWGTGPKHRTVHKGCSSCSECSPGLPCHLWWEKRATTIQISLDIFSRGRVELNPARNQNLCHQHQPWVKLQVVLSLLLLMILCLYHLQSVTLLACSLDASPRMPAIVLYNCTFQDTIRLKMLSLFFVFFFMYYSYESYYKLITVQYYIANIISWELMLTLLDFTKKLVLQRCSQSGREALIA